VTCRSQRGRRRRRSRTSGPNISTRCVNCWGRGWCDPIRTVAAYREDLRRRHAYQAAVDKARATHPVVFCDDDPAPDKAKRLGELFDPIGVTAHRREACLVVRSTSWGLGYDSYEVCTDPRRHAPSRVGTPKGSDLASDRTPARPDGRDDSHAKRKARLARLAHATDTCARSRGGFSQADLIRVALRGLVHEAGRDALAFAATMLGHDQPRDVTVEDLLAGVDTPAALARVAGAVALGQAESRMYWSWGSPSCRDYLAMLTGSGWTPDEWTAAVLDGDTPAPAVTADATYDRNGGVELDDDEVDADTADIDGDNHTDAT
jgi:hypothetical protein